MPALLTIGEFSRASYLTIKTPRHYHDVGLLEPAQVDSSSSDRYYGADQIATAQTIRRLRELEMPVEQVKGVLHTDDAGERNDDCGSPGAHGAAARADHGRRRVAARAAPGA